MIFLRYSILISLLWTFPSFVLGYFSSGLSSALSHLTFLLLLAYYVLIKDKGPFLWIFILLGLSYYLIAGLNYLSFSSTDYFIIILKYLLIAVCGAEVLRKTSLNELYVFLIIGGLSIVINAVLFPRYNANFYPTYGRFSGFYLNPNLAGAVCLAGLALGIGIKDVKLKYLGFLILALGGFFTFSRYFIGMFLLINLILVFINRKFIIAPIIGAACMVLIAAFSSSLNLNADRFNAFQNIIKGDDTESDVAQLEKDSRTETWSRYKDIILSKPVFGHGYGILQGRNNFGLSVGVHNTYLMVIGEAGIVPFTLLIGMYVYFLWIGFKRFKTEPMAFVSALVLSTALLVSHTYFDSFVLLFLSMYLYIFLTEKMQQVEKKEEDLTIDKKLVSYEAVH